MDISFESKDNELILCYSPESGTEPLLSLLKEKGYINIKHVFKVTEENLREPTDEDSLYFSIGLIESEYTKILPNVVGTNNTFYFSNDIKLKKRWFIASRNISILRKIDEVIDADLYVGGDYENHDGIPKSLYMEMLSRFPNSNELTRYSYSRIALVLKEYFPDSEKYETLYNQYMEKKRVSPKTSRTTLEIDKIQYSDTLELFNSLLNDSEEHPEAFWHEIIKNIIWMIYPQYMVIKSKIRLEGTDNYDKEPDFIAVDTNGYVDVIEIKVPDVKLISVKPSYRNNYYPSRDLSGAVQQVQKYIYCIDSLVKNQQKISKAVAHMLPESTVIDFVNPKGMIIAGRNNFKNKQQKKDFELIKRQYKNIVDIITYDDLANRLGNIIKSLENRIAEI